MESMFLKNWFLIKSHFVIGKYLEIGVVRLFVSSKKYKELKEVIYLSYILKIHIEKLGHTFFFNFLLYSYVHTMFGSFLPPSPTPSLPTTPPSPLLLPRYLAETIFPLSLTLLKREYKQ
jgi:hypothetical protein